MGKERRKLEGGPLLWSDHIGGIGKASFLVASAAPAAKARRAGFNRVNRIVSTRSRAAYRGLTPRQARFHPTLTNMAI